MADCDIERSCRGLHFLFHDAPILTFSLNGDSRGVGLRPRTDVVHIPENVRQDGLFPFVHRGDFLGIVRVVGGLYRVYGQHIRPHSSGATHFKNVMRGGGFDFLQSCLILLVDLPDHNGHGHSGAGVFPGKEDPKA